VISRISNAHIDTKTMIFFEQSGINNAFYHTISWWLLCYIDNSVGAAHASIPSSNLHPLHKITPCKLYRNVHILLNILSYVFISSLPNTSQYHGEIKDFLIYKVKYVFVLLKILNYYFNFQSIKYYQF